MSASHNIIYTEKAPRGSYIGKGQTMRIQKLQGNYKNKLLRTLGSLILTTLITYACLTSEAFVKQASDLLIKNTFYIPKKQNISFSGWDMMRSACFGAEYCEPDERPLVLNKNTYTPKSNDGSGLLIPEGSLDIPHSGNLLPIISSDLSSEDILTLDNTTKKRPNTELLLYSSYDFGYDPNNADPLVLVLHTHATECYSREGSSFYDAGSSTHTSDKSVNMIEIGRVFTETLIENGIPTLHCTVMHDESSYSDSYSLAAISIKEYLEKYPSIRYVFDLHRDAVTYESGAKARAECEIDGKKAAQIMLLCGTDAGGADFDHWEKNLSLALKLTDKLSGKYSSLMRRVALRGASYNEQYTNGSLLIEVGTDGNTLSQASYSAELLAKALAELIKS